ncbi:MAG: Hsp20/alpha crystallin family protein [Clostridiales bacterium]|jgi:HSP20 family protein|nr:Hsp20/alpha crystallin family protein [Clostridiales bacterium]
MRSLIPYNNRQGNGFLSTGFEDFYNLLDDFFTPRSVDRATFKLDVHERENEYVVEAELPGVKKGEIALSIDDGRLSISVNQAQSSEEKKKSYLHRERRISSMSRSIYLADASQEAVSAKLEDGILIVSVQKEPKRQTTRKIDIN